MLLLRGPGIDDDDDDDDDDDEQQQQQNRRSQGGRCYTATLVEELFARSPFYPLCLPQGLAKKTL
jgi:hypothetical protein